MINQKELNRFKKFKKMHRKYIKLSGIIEQLKQNDGVDKILLESLLIFSVFAFCALTVFYLFFILSRNKFFLILTVSMIVVLSFNFIIFVVICVRDCNLEKNINRKIHKLEYKLLELTQPYESIINVLWRNGISLKKINNEYLNKIEEILFEFPEITIETAILGFYKYRRKIDETNEFLKEHELNLRTKKLKEEFSVFDKVI